MRLLPNLVAGTAALIRAMSPRTALCTAAARPAPANTVVIEPTSGEQRYTIVFLHGLGDQAHGWASIMPEVDSILPEGVAGHVRWLLPNAPERPITLNGGLRMPGWSDVYGLGPSDAEDAKGFDESAARVGEIVAAEIEAGVPASSIVVGGLSLIHI